jgi:hypothetical protein
MMDKAKWTFMVYMAGDNNLSDAGDMDLDEMRAVGSSPDVNVVVQFDRARDRGTTRYLVQKNGENEQTESLGLTDCGDPQVLIDFVKWASRFSAERYALVLWNHGGGWEPSEMDRIARSAGARNYNVREASERSATRLRKAFFRTSLEKIFSLPTSHERAICSDDGSGHSLDTIELGKVLDKVQKTLGQKLDLLGMDACLMSNLEVAYQARPYVNYIVASEESEPNQGWPYTPVLKKLVGTPDLMTPAFAAHIVEAYIQSYRDMNNPGPITQAAVDLTKIDTLVNPLDKLAGALLDHLPGARTEIWSAQAKSASFFDFTLWDIADFCQGLGKYATATTVKQAAQDVRSALTAGTGNFVLTESHYGSPVERCAGVNIYLIPPPPDVSPYYADLDFAKHRWSEFLQAYHAM